MLTKDDVIRRFCALQIDVSNTLGWNYSYGECFCPNVHPEKKYENTGRSLEWIEKLVRSKLAEVKKRQEGIEKANDGNGT